MFKVGDKVICARPEDDYWVKQYYTLAKIYTVISIDGEGFFDALNDDNCPLTIRNSAFDKINSEDYFKTIFKI